MELGISSPLTQTGPWNFVKSWLTDTATVYRIGIVRTGVLVLVLSLGNIALGGTMMALNKHHSWSSLGLWTGFPMLISGLVCIFLWRKRPDNKVSVLSAACVVALLAALTSLITSVISLWSLSYDRTLLYPSYPQNDSLTPLYVMNGLLLSLSPPQLCFTLWSLFLSIGYVWPCLVPERSNIFTIMVEEEPLERSLVPESDTEMAAFSGHSQRRRPQGGVLEILQPPDWPHSVATTADSGARYDR